MTSVAPPALGSAADTRADTGPAMVRALTGPRDQAGWIRPAFIVMTLFAAVLYLWGLSVSGYANTYYSAAALAASHSWSAWFFGSFDAGNFITIDKPPLGTMIMGLSVRLFGLTSMSILLPQAVAGVATVVVLYVAVRKSFGPVAATIAGVVMAVTPVSVLIFRYNNPDAILTLLLVGAGAAFIRALQTGGLRWVIFAATLVGLGFDAKYLQAYLVLPAFALVYAIAAPGSIRRRIAGLLVAAITVLISSLWWVIAVELIPTDVRPYIGGSTTDSAIQLLLGYDGLGRIFGSGGRDGGGANFSGAAGILRLFNAEFGGQVGWFIPFALVGLATGLLTRLRVARTDLPRAAYLMWGGWFAVTGLVFSLMSGIVHTYYAVALAPAIAALVGAGAVDMWKLRERTRFGGLVLAGAVLTSAIWSWQLLERTPGFAPGLGIGVLIVGTSAAVILAFPISLAGRRPVFAAAALAVAVLLAGPLAYGFDTVASAHNGGDPAAGPSVPGGGGSGGGADGGFRAGGAGVTNGGPPAGGGGFGGGIDEVTTAFLGANQGDATWLAATSSSGSAGSIELATGQPVMAMGGFSGSDPTPTLAELKGYIGSGQLRFVILGGGGPSGGGPGGPGGSAAVATQRNAWVTSSCTVATTGSTATTVYDCAGTVP